MMEQISAQIVPPLLDWFERNARTLPWRSDPTPYHVWVSEIMLQQTRVEACIPYYTRFMAALPDVFALANADEQQLLKLWEGLGYYSRVRNLQKAAKLIVNEHSGLIPSDPEELLKLPGIGPYTAGAIASISYGTKTPAVDGNVLRVVTRLTACGDDITQNVVKKDAAQVLQRILPDAVGKFNQALMEIGALVCVPNGTPNCKVCPLYSQCAAAQTENPLAYPIKSVKKPRRPEEYTVVLLLRDGKFALRQRPEQGLLSGLWEYPNFPGLLTAEQLSRQLEKMGLQLHSVQPVGNAKHIFTHIEWQMTGFLAECETENPPKNWVWVTPSQLHRLYPVPSAFRAFTKLI